MRRRQTKSRKRYEPSRIGERCEDKEKVIFPSFERADKAARQMTWTLRETTREVVKPYVCPYCDQWHIGRGPRGRDIELTQQKGECDLNDDQLKCFMAIAMQTARDAIAMTEPRSEALDAALSSLNIVLGFEADHWQERVRAAVSRS